MATVNCRIGIDLGGTKIEGIALAADGSILARQRIATPAEDYHSICAAIAGLVRSLEAVTGACPVGLGMPGIISPATGLVKNANTVALIGQPFEADLRIALARPVRIENDANCLLLSEVHGGAADGCSSAFGVILGTGTGGSLFVNNGLVVGANAIAGEWGHNPVPWRVTSAAARRCYCGNDNCVETFLSGPGLLRSFVERGGHRARSVEDVVRAAAGGNAIAGATLTAYADQLGACLTTVVNIFDPAVIVLGGGVSQLAGLCAATAAYLATRAFSDTLSTRVVRARFGDSSGVFGAARLWQVGDAIDV